MKYLRSLLLLFLAFGTLQALTVVAGAQSTQSGSIGIEGTIPTTPPTVAATITTPGNGQVFTSTPITVSGRCTTGLLVKIFKNNVFAGSVDCANGSFSLQIDLFSGLNDITARVTDALDQAGPDSNIVSVTFNDSRGGGFTSRVNLTSNYAKRGANPGDTLEWPIILSSGVGPYAVSVDWGDGKATDLISLASPGEFIIRHVYEQPGIYNIIVKATDSNNTTGYLQLVGISNGAISDVAGTSDQQAPLASGPQSILWWPVLVLFPLIFMSFWLGQRHKLQSLRRSLENL